MILRTIALVLLVGPLAAPLAADGPQPGEMWRIGYLGTFPMDPQSAIGSALVDAKEPLTVCTVAVA